MTAGCEPGVGVDKARVYRLFSSALDLDGEARERYLRDECAGDTALLSEVLALLDIAARDTESTLGLLNLPPEPPGESLVNQEFGRFRLLELIGAGGMGVVYRAERTDGVKQAVAIKLLAGELSQTDYARLEREAQLLARLEHPAVARLIDTGIQAGRGWIALEFVRGQPIDAYCDAQRLSLRERVRLLITIVDAVAAAHRMLVVHRDIKPANVLVSEEGLPKLIDFGIAANLNTSVAATQMTADIGRLFTPHYAAPEQVAGEPVTVATDIFGLGALSYRVLAGVVPHVQATGAIRYMLAVARDDVDWPSRAALSARMDERWARDLKGDVDAILFKALARKPELRYGTATELSADLKRYLDGLPVEARRATLWYRCSRFVLRHRAAVAASALLAAGLGLGGILYGLQLREIAQSRQMAARRGQFLESMIKSADPRGGRRDITVAELLDTAAAQSDSGLAAQPLVAASMLGVLAKTNASLDRLPQALAANERQIRLLRVSGAGPDELADALTVHGELMNASGRSADAVASLREAGRLLNNECRNDGRYAAVLTALVASLAITAHDQDAAAAANESAACLQRLAAHHRRL